jgi:hypothetical protein
MDGDGIALEQEFEWVNAWAESTRIPPTPADAGVVKDHARSSHSETPRADKPLNGKASAAAEVPLRAETRARMKTPETADAPKLHVRPIELVSALDPDPAVPAANTAAPEQPAADQVNPGFIRIDGVEPLDSSADAVRQDIQNGHRRGRWTDLFRLVARTQDLRRDESADADAARDLFVLNTAPATSLDNAKATASPPAEAAAPDQLARDIAEIAKVRDKLLAMPLVHNAPLGAIAAVRTSDAVPILVGVVLALTSMMVFAVAASFVSLR